jgi:hypothetical protein
MSLDNVSLLDLKGAVAKIGVAPTTAGRTKTA